MKGIHITQYGGPEVLDLVELPDPSPGPGQVVVTAAAIGVGMPDVLLRSGRYPWAPPLPSIPGIELAGYVSAVGSGVTSLKECSRVLVSSRELPQRGGCYVEKICVDADAVYSLPDAVGFDKAACLSNYQVAWHLLNTALNGGRYDSVLVWAAAGGVGSALVQLARDSHPLIIGVASGAEKCAFVERQGAHACIDRQQEEVGKAIERLTGGNGVSLIFDCVGGASFSRNLDLLAPLGMVVNYGLLQGLPDPSYVQTLHARLGDSLAVRMFSMHLLDQQPALRRKGMEAAIQMLSEGTINPHIHARLPMEKVRDAHSSLESGANLGKIILKPSL